MRMKEEQITNIEMILNLKRLDAQRINYVKHVFMMFDSKHKKVER